MDTYYALSKMYKSKEKTANIRNRYIQVPHLTNDITWESEKKLETITYQRVKNQLFPSRQPQGCIISNRQERVIDMKHR